MSYCRSLGPNIHISHLLPPLLPFHPDPLCATSRCIQCQWTRYSYPTHQKCATSVEREEAKATWCRMRFIFTIWDTRLSNVIWLVNLCGCEFVFDSSGGKKGNFSTRSPAGRWHSAQETPHHLYHQRIVVLNHLNTPFCQNSEAASSQIASFPSFWFTRGWT